MANTFEAAFNGTCARCNNSVEPGDSIGYHGDFPKPCCQNCLRELNDAPICPKCFMSHRGECL